MNYEEGSEYEFHADGESEKVLSEVPDGYTGLKRRDLAIESIYEYGSRVGFWLLMRLFSKYGVLITVTGCAQALELNPAAARTIVEAGHDICCHGWRWVYHSELEEAEERDHIARDLPYWVEVGYKSHLVIPYNLDLNDGKFATAPGYSSGEDILTTLIESFDALYEEDAEAPKMMTVGLHTRIVGRAGRTLALRRFLDHALKHDRVWLCRRIDIAKHWHEHHRPAPSAP
jgi:allantoinase